MKILSVRDIERETQDSKVAKKPKITSSEKKVEPVDPDIANVIEKLQYKFGTSVLIKPIIKG